MVVRYFEQREFKVAASISLDHANEFTEAAEFDYRRPFNLSISGEFEAIVLLRRSFDGGETWKEVYTFTEPIETIVDTNEPGVLWSAGIRLGDHVSGTVTIRLSQ